MSRQKEHCENFIFSSVMQYVQIALAARSLSRLPPKPESESLLLIKINADMSAK